MEDYDKFVEFHLSRFKKTQDVDESKPKSSSSICFHGRPILPPVLSGTQREEMARLKEAAQKAAENRKHKDDTRMSYVQTMLQSVEIRKTPTLEELLKETDIDSQVMCSDGGSTSPPKTTEMVKECVHPLTSTACSALLTSHVPPQTSYNTSLDSSSFKVDCQQLSSGYDSYTNIENTSSAIISQKEDIFQMGENGVEGFFIHNSSDTVKKMPDIINYSPVDGDELERSSHESLTTDLNQSISLSSVEESCGFTPEQTGQKETSHLVSQSDNGQEVELSFDSIEPLTDTPAVKCLTEKHTQLNDRMLTDDEDLQPSQEPYRMSLQELLKKSQEYRRRQRMLRSQAKSAKIQDRAQEQPKSEEPSLSDKENDEHHTKATEPKKNQGRSDSHSSIVEQSLKKSYESDITTNIFDESHIATDSQAKDIVVRSKSETYNSIRINNWVNTSLPVWTGRKSSVCSASTSPTTSSDVKKYHNIPALNFCKSPVPCKTKIPSAPLNNISQNIPVINASINTDEVEESSGQTSPLNVVESDLTTVLAKSSQHIDQLEFNLSGLKVLISDLECTLTESRNKSSRSESQQTQISHSDSVCWLGDVSPSQKSQSLDSVKSDNDKNSLAEVNSLHVMTRLEHAQNTKRPTSVKCALSTAQRMLIPDVFRTCLPETTSQKNDVSVLSDASNRSVNSDLSQNSRRTSLNQSYDVDVPSELWLHGAYGSQKCQGKQLTPESAGESQGVGSKVKRRLQMTDVVQEKGDEAKSKPSSSTPKAAAQWHRGLDSVKEREETLKRIHAEQIRAMQQEHQRQQQQLLQALASQYRLLQSVSLPCSRLGDTATFPALSQPGSGSLPEHYRHQLAAAAKGFLTRRLLRTERVAQLVRTAKDTQQFLQAFQKPTLNKGNFSRQDLMLQKRVTLQLRAARYEIHDIFFGLSEREKMQLISVDRDLARDRQLKRQNASGGQQSGKSALSAATQKSLERKRGLMIQKKTAERHRGAGMKTRHKAGFPAQKPLETRAGQHRARPQRIPKSTYTPRPR